MNYRNFYSALGSNLRHERVKGALAFANLLVHYLSIIV